MEIFRMLFNVRIENDIDYIYTAMSELGIKPNTIAHGAVVLMVPIFLRREF